MKCPAGNFAPKVHEYGHFEKMPIQIFTFCSETNDLGNPKNCEIIQGFHINKEGMIDSGVGLPIGQKVSLKSFI